MFDLPVLVKPIQAKITFTMHCWEVQEMEGKFAGKINFEKKTTTKNITKTYPAFYVMILVKSRGVCLRGRLHN